MPPTNCGPNGRLRKLVLAGVGLDCGDKGLPPSFADLDELNTLDLAYNRIGGTTTDLADLVSQVCVGGGGVKGVGWLAGDGGAGAARRKAAAVAMREQAAHSRLPPVPPHPPQMPELRRLYMRHTNLTGTLECGLVDNPTLTVVSLSGNEGITGEVPPCYLNVRRAQGGRGRGLPAWPGRDVAAVLQPVAGAAHALPNGTPPPLPCRAG
jgi:hypothetical protein